VGNVTDLLAAARAAGLTLKAHGDRLRITGPKSAESIVRKIQAHKAEVLAALRSVGETHDHDSDPMSRAFSAAGLPTTMPHDPDQARARLHRLLCHQAPRPEGVPTGVDVVLLLGGHHPGPKLLCSYEPWPSDPVPLRWRPTGSEAWRALGLEGRANG
jgi:tubulysin polyketide synthase-like protein